MPHITEKMLAQHLRQLEADELILRVALPVIPPHVTYSLTEAGMALRPVLYAMANWAIEDGRKKTSRFLERWKNSLLITDLIFSKKINLAVLTNDGLIVNSFEVLNQAENISKKQHNKKIIFKKGAQ